MKKNWTKWMGIGAVVLVSAAGCADRNKNGQPDSLATPSEVANATDHAVSGAGQSVENAAAGLSNEASKAGQSVKNAATGATKAVSGALNTPKIKTTLANNPGLVGSNINVDTLPEKNTIALRGTVKNAAQSKLAQNLAQKEAGAGYKVVNQLKVSGGASPMMKKKM